LGPFWGFVVAGFQGATVTIDAPAFAGPFVPFGIGRTREGEAAEEHIHGAISVAAVQDIYGYPMTHLTVRIGVFVRLVAVRHVADQETRIQCRTGLASVTRVARGRRGQAIAEGVVLTGGEEPHSQ
jgi:hypothetical protein